MPFPQKQVIIPMAHVRNLYSGNFLLAKTARIWDNSVAANFLVEHAIPLEKGADTKPLYSYTLRFPVSLHVETKTVTTAPKLIRMRRMLIVL